MLDAIILAAGKSTRFGRNKLAHPLADGRTMLATTVSVYAAVFERVSVVMPEQALHLRQLLEGYNVSVVESTNAAAGMSQSLIAGIQAASEASAWMIGLADMPYISQDTLLALAEESAEDRIIQPVFQQKTGHPVIFGREFQSELLSLTGDSGAKSVIQRNIAQLRQVPVTDHGVIKDIDRPTDILGVEI